MIKNGGGSGLIVQRTRESMRKDLLSKAESLNGKWVIGSKIDTERSKSVICDPDWDELMDFYAKSIFRIEKIDNDGYITSPRTPSFFREGRLSPVRATFFEAVEFENGDPTPEEIEMYRMLGYVFW